MSDPYMMIGSYENSPMRQIEARQRRRELWESLPVFCTCGPHCMKDTEFADGDCRATYDGEKEGKGKTVLTSKKRGRHYHRADEGNC